VTVRAPSLFWRLVGAISALLLLGAGLIAYAASGYASRAANEAYDQLLIGAAQQFRETLRVEDGVITSDIPVSAFDALSLSQAERVYYRIAGPGGETLTGYDDLSGTGPTARAPGETEVWSASYKGNAIRAAAVRHYMAEPQAAGWVSVIVAHTTETREALARELTFRALLIIAIMAMIALAGVIGAVRFALGPLHRIEALLGARDPNDLTPIEAGAPREIEELVDAINRFMQRLADRMDELRHMIDDAAHQIRTPVAALAAQVDLLQNEKSVTKRRRHLERVAARTAQIGRLVNQLLSQTLVSHRARSVTADRLDLRDVVRQALADAVPITLERDIAVTVSIPETPIMLAGDAVSLREAIRNIIDNAIQHGATSRLGVTVSETAGAVTLTISDDGPGIPVELRDKVVKRFWRTGSGSEGFGLGLAIASDVAKSHGARLEFGSATNGDFAVRLIFLKGVEG
jgi:two-component system sensor histidine kinase TctE